MIHEGLRVADAELAELVNFWFGGNGFKHIFCGEEDDQRIKGYHFWFTHLMNERLGIMLYEGANYFNEENELLGIQDKKLVSAKISSSVASVTYEKSISSFTVGESPEAVIIAAFVASKLENSSRPQINLNGVPYEWSLRTRSGQLTTFFPWVPNYLEQDKL